MIARQTARFGLVAATTFAVGMIATNWGAVRSRLPTYYANCDWARAAGAAPINRGEPGYRQPLDADHDGIACEPYPAGASFSEADQPG